MKSSIIKYGLISGTVLVAILLSSSFFLEQGPEDYKLSEIVGYSAIVLSLMLILVAQHEYSKQLTSPLKYGQALIIGLAISTIAGIAFGLYNLVYISFINPEFMEQYYSYYIENIRNSGASDEQIEATIAKLNSEKEMWMSPGIQFIGMFMTVFVVGLVVSLISAGFMTKLSQRKLSNV